LTTVVAVTVRPAPLATSVNMVVRSSVRARLPLKLYVSPALPSGMTEIWPGSRKQLSASATCHCSVAVPPSATWNGPPVALYAVRASSTLLGLLGVEYGTADGVSV
jgi:hypothetical protein